MGTEPLSASPVERRFMFNWQKILRILLIMALVPMIAAAGLPLNACQCSTSTAETIEACCGDAGASCCGEGECACRAAKKADVERPAEDCCGHATSPAAGETSHDSRTTQLSCQCGSEPASLPATPVSPSVELVSPPAATTTFAVVVPQPPVVTSSCERSVATLLPSDDLPTIFCTLLI